MGRVAPDAPVRLASAFGRPGATVGSEFLYNANRSRTIQLEFDSMTAGAPLHYTRKRVYAMGPTLELNYENSVPSDSGQSWTLDTVRIYVPGPDGIVGAREFRPASGGSEKALVYHYDHLGSITAITDYGSTSSSYSIADGNKTGRYSADAWGQRRNPLTWSGTPPSTTDDGGSDSLTPRGFTGHEMLDDLGLVHMNGRIYDPLLGRFLSADILVEDKMNLQCFNRYSYVRNNPLTFTDPSGFFRFPQHTGIVTEAYKRVFPAGKSTGVTFRIKDSGYTYTVQHNSFLQAIQRGSIRPDIPQGLIVAGAMVVDHAAFTTFDKANGQARWEAAWKGNETFESHYGSKQYLHAMQSSETSAQELQDNIVNSIVDRVVKARADIADGKWTDGGVGLGSAAHTVADSFSRSHVERDENGMVVRFNNYNEQDSGAHAVADKEEKDEYRMAIDATTRVLSYALSEDFTAEGLAEILRKEIIPINEQTQVGNAPADDEFRKK